MKRGLPGPFGAQLKALREAAGFTQEELATIAGLSVHAVSALERGERRRPQLETVRALSAALDLTGPARDAFIGSARAGTRNSVVDELTRGSLPLAPTALLGRDADVRTLRGWLDDHRSRLVTLTGPGGAGKTRLALEIARSAVEEGTTRVGFVSLAAIRSPTFVVSAIAETLGLSDVTPLDLPKRARIACTDQPTLLVLDNFEQVLGAAPVVAGLLASVPTLRVLVTSRAPLRVRGEREYAVGPLELAVDTDEHSPAVLARSPAVRLLLDRIRDVRPGFRLTPSSGPTVAAICRQLDALPLALELAAPWMKVLTAQELLRRLTHDVLLPTAAPRDLPERQRTMSATVAWSYHLLDASEQRVFRRLGALPGRFPIEAVAAVLGGGAGAPAGGGEPLGVVASLIDKSLLLQAETSLEARPLYQMLETVRAYAALELAAAGERDDALEGLASHSIGEASRAATGLVGPAQAEWLDRVRDDLEMYRASLAWLLEQRRAAEASEIAWALLFFWLIRGHGSEGLEWYEQILNVPSLPPAAESRALLGAAVMSYAHGKLERARTRVTRALALADRAGDADVAAQAENLYGHLDHAGGDLDAARRRFARSMMAFRAVANPWGVGNALIGMASVALAAGEVDEAERRLDEATVVLQHAGPWFVNLPLYIRAILAVRRMNPDEAIALVRESVTRSRQLHDRFAFVYALIPLAAAAALKGDYNWAARVLGARDAVTERTGAIGVDKSVRDIRERAEREARERLGPDRWTRAYGAGRDASIDALLRDIENVLGKE
jgi:predicted ATPase/DNA-binding XRE family transcriptional regulator